MVGQLHVNKFSFGLSQKVVEGGYKKVVAAQLSLCDELRTNVDFRSNVFFSLRLFHTNSNTDNITNDNIAINNDITNDITTGNNNYTDTNDNDNADTTQMPKIVKIEFSKKILGKKSFRFFTVFFVFGFGAT